RPRCPPGVRRLRCTSIFSVPRPVLTSRTVSPRPFSMGCDGLSLRSNILSTVSSSLGWSSYRKSRAFSHANDTPSADVWPDCKEDGDLVVVEPEVPQPRYCFGGSL